jgi:hypothetical protein
LQNKRAMLVTEEHYELVRRRTKCFSPRALGDPVRPGTSQIRLAVYL